MARLQELVAGIVFARWSPVTRIGIWRQQYREGVSAELFGEQPMEPWRLNPLIAWGLPERTRSRRRR